MRHKLDENSEPLWSLRSAIRRAAVLPAALLPVLSLIAAGIVYGEAPPRAQVGLRVHPPVMVVGHVVPGTAVELPAPITIENTGETSILCVLEPLKPSAIGMKRMPGYVDVPDASWLTPARDTLTLGPGERASVPVSLRVPEGECHDNRSWCATLSVASTGGGMLGAAAYPYFYIETVTGHDGPRPPKAADGARALPEDPLRGTGTNDYENNRAAPRGGDQAAPAPSGCLIIGSHVLDAGDVVAGDTTAAGFITVENGYKDDVFVKLRPSLPSVEGIARRVLITPGHTWMKSTGWLQAARQGLFLLAGKKAHFEIDVASPSNPSTYNFRWEGFVEISGPNGPESLVRVHWRTTSPDTTNRRAVRAGRPAAGDTTTGHAAPAVRPPAEHAALDRAALAAAALGAPADAR